MDAIYRSTLFNDGEGITDGDLNSSQRRLSARLYDQILRATRRTMHVPAAGSATADADIETTWNAGAYDSTIHCWALTGGGGYCYPGGSALQTTVRAGTILQHVAAPNGTEEQLLAYSFTANEFTLTHAIGDATNPRIDLIEVQLALGNGTSTSRDFKDASTFALSSSSVNKDRGVSVTVQIKQGTPGATPAYPTPTSGFCVMAAVYVPATHNAVFTRDHYIDTRFPLGLRVYDVPASQFDLGASTRAWAQATGIGRRSVVSNNNSPASDPFLIYPPQTGMTTRVIGVALFGVWTTPAPNNPLGRLVRVGYQNGTPTITELADLTTTICGIDNTIRYRHCQWDAIAQLSSGPDNRGSSGLGQIGDAFWCNGRRNGPIEEFYNMQNVAPLTTIANRLALEINGEQLSEVWMARWFLAGGL